MNLRSGVFCACPGGPILAVTWQSKKVCSSHRERLMADDNKVETTTVPRKAGTVPVAGIGASAGGVGALQTFFRTLPADTGAAYVVVVHLDPEHQSDLARILSTCTRMPVKEVAGTGRSTTNASYGIPPQPGCRLAARHISHPP